MISNFEHQIADAISAKFRTFDRQSNSAHQRYKIFNNQFIRKIHHLTEMTAPDIETSTREERLEFIREEFKCLGNCPICGKCSFLRGRDAEYLYAGYIDGHCSFRDITAEHRNNNAK